MRILITGAAKGFGRGLALAFAGKGHDLTLVDIDRNGLDQTAKDVESAGVKCHLYVVDVSDRVQVNELAEKVNSEIGGIDMLINNAGVLVIGDFIDIPIEEWERVMGVNFWGYIYMIKAFLPFMLKRGSGQVVNVSSIGGLIGCPVETAYGSSKFAICGMTEALYNEVADKGVKVTLVCPSTVETNIHNASHHYGYGKDYDDDLFRNWGHDFDKSIAEMVRGIEKGKFLVIAGRVGKFAYYGRRISHGGYLAIQRRLYRSKQKFRV